MEKSEILGTEGRVYCPFLREKSEEILKKLLIESQPKRVLEIGTFLGYSAAVILETCPTCSLVTIEKEEEKCAFARQNLQKFGSRVQVICDDAGNFLNDQSNRSESFDFIFLDGPKAQYHAYLPHLKRLLSHGGILVCDDVLFYGLVRGEGFVKHKHRTIVERLRLFLNELQADPDFETVVYEFEDGLSVSRKK